MKIKINRERIVVSLIGIFAGLILSLIIIYSVKSTSTDNFCSTCHSMKPITKSYYADVHGGANRRGFKAKCVDCHLPQTGTIRYMWTKGVLGIHDIFVETFFNTSKIDWEGMRKRRFEFTYDSGCKKCHSDYLVKTRHSLKAVIAHKAYENGHESSCVNCHRNVGHHNISDYLKVLKDNLEKQK